MKKFLLFIFLLFSVVLFSKALIFEHATVYYPEGYENLAIKVGNIFEDIRDDVVNMFKNDPGRINIFIKTKTTITNGYANPLQNNTIVIYTWHPTGVMYNYLPLDDWYRYLLIHEFTHIVTLKPSDGILKTLSDLKMPYTPSLGKFSVEAPTVFAESSFSENSGRLRNPVISDALFSTFGGTFPQDKIANDFRVGQVFYNGNGGFLEYLVKKYGMEKVNKYLKDSINKSYSWLEIMLNFSIPYVSLIRLPEIFTDDFRAHFGNNFEDEVSEWLNSLNVKFDGEKIYEGKNERIYKIEKVDNKLYILKSKFGAATGYLDNPINELIVLEKGNILAKYNLSALDFKVDSGEIYALVSTNNKTEIWNIGKNEKIVDGFISAFDVYDGKVIYSIYDDKTDESMIHGLNEKIAVNGFIRSLAFDGENLYYLVGNSLYKDNNLIDNYYLKGAFLKKTNDGIYVTMKFDNYMELLDVKNFRLLSKGLYAFDGEVSKDEIYYVSYSQNGMAVYKTKFETSTIESVIAENSKLDDYTFRKASLLEEKKYNFVPSLFAPFFLTSSALGDFGGYGGWSVGSIFDFKTSIDSDLVLAPYYLRYFKDYTNFYNEYGLGYAYLLYKDRFSILNAGLFRNTEDYFYGVTEVSFIPFVFRVGYNSNLSLNMDISGFYFATGTSLDYSFNFTPGIVYSNNTFSSSLYLTAYSQLGNSEVFSLSSGVSMLNILNENSYVYGNLVYNFESSTYSYSGIFISNIFPFYKQSGIGVGVNGGNDFNGLFYVFVGFPNNNQLYLQSGFEMDMSGKLTLFFGMGAKPHSFYFINEVY
ncbi:MAG: hypothetical protein PWQ45_1591 [Thermosipho sp. (in: thermotogales)]|nr:hypothetical protein [Thermosipho sp. (in: thermotogales)]